MKITKSTLVLSAVLALAGLAAGWWFGNASKGQNMLIPTSTAALIKPQTNMVGTPLPASLQWQGFDGESHNLTDWLGKVLVVNHWATWCPPCRAEMPLFIEYQKQLGEQGLQFVGIAHDSIDRGQPFLDSIGMNYPNLLAGDSQGMEWAQSLGSRGSLPFTEFYDREGKLVMTKLGEVRDQDLKEIIQPLLKGK